MRKREAHQNDFDEMSIRANIHNAHLEILNYPDLFQLEDADDLDPRFWNVSLGVMHYALKQSINVATKEIESLAKQDPANASRLDFNEILTHRIAFLLLLYFKNSQINEYGEIIYSDEQTGVKLSWEPVDLSRN